MNNIEQNYLLAKEMYASISVDTDKVIDILKKTPISVNCWQLDDVTGFEKSNQQLTGGIAATGSYPGKPKNIDEYRKQAKKVLDLIPGFKKLNLHAIYLDADDENVDRNEILPAHFRSWVDFAKENKIGLDFNPTCFSHPLSEDGFTLSHQDEHVRQFWIEHVIKSRKVGEYFGKELGMCCNTNIWIPDGYKDNPIDKLSPRLRLKESLDEIFKVKINQAYNRDAVESKLFGIGSESYVTGSHEFYTNYVTSTHNAMICLDAGHFHPTETISNKISSYLAFNQEILIHVSRPVRWDSDHVVILDDETKAIMHEIVRLNALNQVNIALDFFDGSINRKAATVIGARNTQKALLYALLEPSEQLKTLEKASDYTKRLALVEEYKTMPFGLVWDYFCEIEGVPGKKWLEMIK